MVAAGVALPSPVRGQASVGTVSLTFDDGQASQATLDLEGLPATFYVNSNLVGSGLSYMTWDAVRARAAAGHEIGGHSLTHPRLGTLSDEVLRQEVCDDRDAIQRNLSVGRAEPAPAPSSFAYPYGDYDDTVKRTVQECGYTSARGVAAVRTAESIPARDMYALRIFKAVTTSTTLRELQAAVTRAESTGGWAIFLFHGVCDNRCAGTYSIKPATFEAFLDWLRLRPTVVVRPVGDVVAGQ